MVKNILRRKFWVVLVIIGMIFLGFGVGQAMAKQPNMNAALVSLNSAKSSLEKASADKAGHRARAITKVKEAIIEVKAGIKAGS